MVTNSLFGNSITRNCRENQLHFHEINSKGNKVQKKGQEEENNGECDGYADDRTHGYWCLGSVGMREPQGYRETVQWLTEQTDGKGWLSISEIAILLGLDRKTVRNKFGIDGGGCALPVLAMKMTGGKR